MQTRSLGLRPDVGSEGRKVAGFAVEFPYVGWSNPNELAAFELQQYEAVVWTPVANIGFADKAIGIEVVNRCDLREH